VKAANAEVYGLHFTSARIFIIFLGIAVVKAAERAVVSAIKDRVHKILGPGQTGRNSR
jgi:hypothetical protein